MRPERQGGSAGSSFHGGREEYAAPNALGKSVDDDHDLGANVYSAADALGDGTDRACYGPLDQAEELLRQKHGGVLPTLVACEFAAFRIKVMLNARLESIDYADYEERVRAAGQGLLDRWASSATSSAACIDSAVTP